MITLSKNALDFLAGIILGDTGLSPERSGPELAEFFQNRVFVWEVSIERRRSEPGTFADHIGRQPFKADFFEQFRGRIEHAFHRPLGAVLMRCCAFAGLRGHGDTTSIEGLLDRRA